MKNESSPKNYIKENLGKTPSWGITQPRLEKQKAKAIAEIKKWLKEKHNTYDSGEAWKKALIRKITSLINNL